MHKHFIFFNFFSSLVSVCVCRNVCSLSSVISDQCDRGGWSSLILLCIRNGARSNRTIFIKFTTCTVFSAISLHSGCRRADSNLNVVVSYFAHSSYDSKINSRVICLSFSSLLNHGIRLHVIIRCAHILKLTCTHRLNAPSPLNSHMPV